MVSPLKALVGLCLWSAIAGCKKDASEDPAAVVPAPVNAAGLGDTIVIGDTTGMQVVYRDVLVQPPGVGQVDVETLDLDQDGVPDLSFGTLVSASPGSGLQGRAWLTCLRPDVWVHGYRGPDTTFVVSTTSFYPFNSPPIMVESRTISTYGCVSGPGAEVYAVRPDAPQPIWSVSGDRLAPDLSVVSDSLLLATTPSGQPFADVVGTSNDTIYTAQSTSGVDCYDPAVGMPVWLAFKVGAAPRSGWIHFTVDSDHTVRLHMVAVRP